MNNPQTPMEAAQKAIADFQSIIGYDSHRMARDSVLAFLQWFESEPEGVERAIHEASWYGNYEDSVTMPANKDRLEKAAKAAIRHLKSMVK